RRPDRARAPRGRARACRLHPGLPGAGHAARARPADPAPAAPRPVAGPRLPGAPHRPRPGLPARPGTARRRGDSRRRAASAGTRGERGAGPRGLARPGGLADPGAARGRAGDERRPIPGQHYALGGMSILEQVQEDVKTAMKAGEKERVGQLRMIVNALQAEEKEGKGDEIAALQRERKRRLDAAEELRKGDREEQAKSEEDEAKLIEGYLPEQLSDEELSELVTSA